MHAATDMVSRPLEWDWLLPREWADDARRRRAAGVTKDVEHVPKSMLALGLPDRLADELGRAPVIVADAGCDRSVSFRQALEDRSWSYVVAVDPEETVEMEAAQLSQVPYGGLGPPTRPCCCEASRPLTDVVDATTLFQQMTWRQGSKAPMTSRFAVLQVRPAGKPARSASRNRPVDAAGGTVY
ncbi:hypothetical protein AT728_39960 [Streptomyces silvensis]|uniref:Transposase IS701-like DDE domain-containing protein n=1 Tax=Streptomyces silvensis TaxID=1765722 RepID=A0A0W7WQU7_9ACTN|nr:hypothetical protein AT728_39960 [Streptomyces silvensis]